MNTLPYFRPHQHCLGQDRCADRAGGLGLPQLAAREVTRYLYLRTGVLPEQIAQDGAIVIAKGFDAGDG